MTSSEKIRHILTQGNPSEKRELFLFDSYDSNELVAKKFELYARSQYPRYFTSKSCKEHRQLILNLVAIYRSNKKKGLAEVAFRGFGKTAIAKLFITFVLQNDKKHIKKYLKILTRDGKNSRQIVTDIYNLMLETQYIYGPLFEKEGQKKREETMGSFTMKCGVKLASGTVGQTQRGHIQDAFRPDLIWFDDIEDTDSVSSAVVTQGVIEKVEEAINGLAKDADYFTTANYISDSGSVQFLLNRCNTVHIIPIVDSDGNPTWDAFSTSDVQHLRDTALDFWGEYMCDPGRSDGKFFDVERIENDMKKVEEPKRISGKVKYWRNYEPHHYYGAGSDHSEGIGRDANALALFDFFTGDLVATHADNKISPDLSAHEYARVASEFGNCLYAPEVNNKCGGIVISTLNHIPYNNIYRDRKEDRITHHVTEKLGWETNSKTKNKMFMDFKRDYNDGLINIYDLDVLKEMKAYNNTDLTETTTGLITRHFDLLTAVVIAWQMKNHSATSPKIKDFYKNLQRNTIPNSNRVTGAAS